MLSDLLPIRCCVQFDSSMQEFPRFHNMKLQIYIRPRVGPKDDTVHHKDCRLSLIRHTYMPMAQQSHILRNVSVGKSLSHSMLVLTRNGFCWVTRGEWAPGHPYPPPSVFQ